MISIRFLTFILLPVSVSCHNCPAFVLNTTEARDEVLGIPTNFFPQSIKDIIGETPGEEFTGNYDCHNVEGNFEVGVAFICDEDQECSCTALYQFEECNSCEICGEIGDVNAFTADCSNVQGFTKECVVECGYITEGCFDPIAENTTVAEEETSTATATNETSTTTTLDAPTTTPIKESSSSSVARYWLGTRAALVCFVMLILADNI